MRSACSLELRDVRFGISAQHVKDVLLITRPTSGELEGDQVRERDVTKVVALGGDRITNRVPRGASPSGSMRIVEVDEFDRPHRFAVLILVLPHLQDASEVIVCIRKPKVSVQTFSCEDLLETPEIIEVRNHCPEVCVLRSAHPAMRCKCEGSDDCCVDAALLGSASNACG